MAFVIVDVVPNLPLDETPCHSRYSPTFWPLFFHCHAANICNLVYNKWHETELESKVGAPYSDWEPAQLTSFLKQKGVDTGSRDAATANISGLLEQVKSHWYETEEKAEDAWSNVKDWIFDRYIFLRGGLEKLLTFVQLDGFATQRVR
jgi:hypothetical protein